MAQPVAAEPVKLFIAALWGKKETLREARLRLESIWGAVDFSGPEHPFDTTDYYAPEMGKNLYRCLFSFQELFPPEQLGAAKHQTNAIEEKWRDNGARPVNLDVGYLDLNKVVLASFKGAGQKLYLGNGAWADLVARYRAGRYQPFEWTFPDFRDGRYDAELGTIREIYRRQLSRRRATLRQQRSI